MVQTLASSAAIPYGQALTAEEMEYLTQELFKLSEANYTPDGKPTLSCLTNEELEKMNVTLLYNGVTYTQAEHQVLDGLDENQKAYFYLTQEFMYGKSISILVDWGDNNPITYTFTFNINVENEDTTV